MSIEILPVEIFHRIFDNLDASTIILSVRSVCRLFRAVVNTYDRYLLDFRSISKSNFHLLCRLIDPHAVRSLILCDHGYTSKQISLFLSSVRLRQFTRLHSITLLGIEEFQMNMILKRINLSLLKSFSLDIQKYDDRRKNTTLHYLSSIMAQSSLKKVQLCLRSSRISDISWPSNCGIEYLSINEDIHSDDLCKILSACSAQLHTLIIKKSIFTTIHDRFQTVSLTKLTSLTIENLVLTIDELEKFLLLTPALSYLKLIGQGFQFDGKRWEEFIQINLPHLDKFEFYIDVRTLTNQTHQDLDVLIQPFRSSFWMEYKKWFVTGEINMNQSYRIQIYSIPYCQSVLEYNFDSKLVFVSTSTQSRYNDPLSRNNINEISLPLKILPDDSGNKQELTRPIPLFPKVTKLHIDISRRRIFDSMKFLTSILDLSQLVEVNLKSFYFNKDNKDLLFEVLTMIEQSCHLSSLIIHSQFCKYELYPYLDNLCSIIPRQIKHLQIPINQLNHIEIILERCPHLSIVQFEITRTKFSQEVIRWFTENTIDSSFRRHAGCDIVWIGKRIHEIKDNHKRIKLTDESQLNS